MAETKPHDKGAPLIDPTDWFDAPRSLLLGVLRVLWWLAWDFFVETIGWTIGWCVLRLLTLGRYPKERLSELDHAPTATAIFVEMVGLAVLALAIWGLAGKWP